MNYKFGLVILVLALAFNANSQEQYTGYHMDNYAGSVATRIQPAEIVDNRFKFHFSSASSLALSNNHLATNFNAAFFLGNQVQAHREHAYRGYNTFNWTMDIIGGQLEINHQNAIGYSFRYNFFQITDGIPEIISMAQFEDFVDNPVVGTPIDYKRFSIQRFGYFEHSFNYGRVIKEDNEHYLKAGGALKIINGGNAEYLFSKSGTFTLTDANSPNVQINSNDIEYGFAENTNSLTNRGAGGGLDLGVVYEYRPDYKSFFYDMDGETDIPRYDVNKYKFKVGVSLTNIGFVRFTKDTNSYDFQTIDLNANANSLISNQVFGANPAADFANTLTFAGPSAVKSGTNKEKFNMSLPSSLNVQFDYHIWKGLYASYSGAFPINIPGDANRVYNVMTHAVTPRWERSMWSVATPFTIKRNGQFNFGVVGRLSLGNLSVFAGSHSMSFLYGNRKQYDASVFAGMSISLKHSIPKDRDKDLVSDGKDRCINDPGPWKYRGCPDTDLDEIIDLEDHCIYDQGPAKTDGCPDRDLDGVIDVNDRCPDTYGLAVHYGCPDKDKDGVIDLADRCPDVPGIELNNGCPFENQGCCMDNDGDGISDTIDECPEVSGSVYNKGCPIDSTNLESIDFQTIKPIVDPNHTEVQIKDTLDNGSTDVDKGKDKDEPVQIESLQDIPVINGGGKELKRLTVYFDTDQSYMQQNYVDAVNRLIETVDFKANKNMVFVVIGHTDSDGSDNYNLILSKRRAETVKKHLINKGVPSDQVKVYYYGEWQPLNSEDNEEKKGINRRAEIKVMRK